MYARVTTSHVHGQKVEEGKRLWAEQVIPTMKKHKGFRHAYILGDDKTGRMITLSLWDTEADANAWGQCEPQKKLSGQLKDKVKDPMEPELYEIKLEG